MFTLTFSTPTDPDQLEWFDAEAAIEDGGE